MDAVEVLYYYYIMTQAAHHREWRDAFTACTWESKENSEPGAIWHSQNRKEVFNHLQSVKLGTHKTYNRRCAHPRVLCVPVKGDARTQGFQHHALRLKEIWPARPLSSLGITQPKDKFWLQEVKELNHEKVVVVIIIRQKSSSPKLYNIILQAADDSFAYTLDFMVARVQWYRGQN